MPCKLACEYVCSEEIENEGTVNIQFLVFVCSLWRIFILRLKQLLSFKSQQYLAKMISMDVRE